MAKYDLYGWLTHDEVFVGRQATSEPQTIPEARVAGEPYPNWTGYEWVMIPYIPPPATEEPPPSELPLPQQRHISVGAFFDRFGPSKWAILADTRPEVQALIKDSSVRRHIDLNNPDLPVGLGLLVSMGYAIDPDQIIHAPIRKDELP